MTVTMMGGGGVCVLMSNPVLHLHRLKEVKNIAKKEPVLSTLKNNSNVYQHE